MIVASGQLYNIEKKPAVTYHIYIYIYIFSSHFEPMGLNILPGVSH